MNIQIHTIVIPLGFFGLNTSMFPHNTRRLAPFLTYPCGTCETLVLLMLKPLWCCHNGRPSLAHINHKSASWKYNICFCRRSNLGHFLADSQLPQSHWVPADCTRDSICKSHSCVKEAEELQPSYCSQILAHWDQICRSYCLVYILHQALYSLLDRCSSLATCD